MRILVFELFLGARAVAFTGVSRFKLAGFCLLLLLVGESAAQAQYVVGETVNFTITTTNNTGGNWSNVAIVDTLPADLTYVSCSGATCGLVGGSVIWRFPVIVNGSSASVTFVATINSCVPSTYVEKASIDVGAPMEQFFTNAVTDTIGCLTNTPTPSPTITDSPTDSPTSTQTATMTFTPTATSSFTPTATFTPTNTLTVTNTPTNSSTPTPTNTSTLSPTQTPSSTPTPSATA